MSNWSMKTDRDLMELARSKMTVDQIAAKLETTPKTVIKAAKRLGLKVRPPHSRKTAF
jgi:hypothetical protein